MIRPFSLLIKPAAADCNLHCEYCFYLDRAKLYPETEVHRMSEIVLEKTISSYMETVQTQYSFGWQGGEPTLMGIDFFRKITNLQQKYGGSGSIVANGVQTNATLIDDEMAAHFAKYNFLLGVSLDGPAAIHDIYRKKISGNQTHSEVMKKIEILGKHKVEFNILILVSKANVGKAREVYKYLTENGFYYHQYIPCVEFGSDGKLLPYSINGWEWGNFMCEIFDSWFAKDSMKVSIRLFDSVIALLTDNVRNICHFGRNCRQYFVVEYNGDVYPCDFFVRKELKLGNIMENTWEEMRASEIYRKFGELKANWHPLCDKCQFVNICCGDCLKHRPSVMNFNGRSLSELCAGWKMFFEHTLPKFKKLSKRILKMRAASTFISRSR